MEKLKQSAENVRANNTDEVMTVKKKKIYIGCLVVLSVCVVVVIGKKELFNEYFSPVKLQYISSYLNNNYLYSVDEKKGMDAIYSGFLSGVENSVTYYLEKGDFQQAQIQESGNYYGTGIAMMWSMDGQSFTVTKVIPGSPADKAGVTAGDHINKINDIQVLMANSQTLMEQAFDYKKEMIRYTIVHQDEIKELVLKPAEVALEDIESKKLDDVIYIKVQTIQEGTSRHIESLLEQAEREKSKGVILDLRDLYTNNAAEISKISDLFLESGTAFKVKTKGDKIKSYQTNEGSFNGKLCLITNTGTKAGAEALVLALRDKAYKVGSDTSGLEYIRMLISLDDGSGMSVASGSIYDQYGNELPEEGISPDERVYIGEEEKLEIIEKGIVSMANDSFIKAALKYFQ